MGDKDFALKIDNKVSQERKKPEILRFQALSRF